MSQAKVQSSDLFRIWPMILDYSRQECHRILRRMELEAYSKLVSVFRAQGSLTNEKRKMLQKLQRFLSIPNDRHKAEVRRALNDEELATISDMICGKEVSEEWITEGKRLVPISYRPSSETAYLAEATKTAADQRIQNNRLPLPSETASLSKVSVPQHRERRLFISNGPKRSEVSTADKSTETPKAFMGQSPMTECDVTTRITDSVPPMQFEVTCETDTTSAVTVQEASLPNGHVPIRRKSLDHIPLVSHHPTTKELTGSHLKHLHHLERLQQQQQQHHHHHHHQQRMPPEPTSPQAAMMMTMMEPFSPSHKAHDLVQTITKQSPIDSPRKRPASTNLHTVHDSSVLSTTSSNTTTTNTTLLNLVHTPSTMGRRALPTHLVTNVTSGSMDGPMHSHMGAVFSPMTSHHQTVTRLAPPTTFQRNQSGYATNVMSSNKSLVHTQGGSTQVVSSGNLGTPQFGTRPHSQLVVQMCRTPANMDIGHASDLTSVYQRIPSSSAGTLLVPARSTAGTTINRTYPSLSGTSSNSSKIATQLFPRTVMRTGSDVSDARSLCSSSSPTISIVQSVSGIPNINRLHGTTSVVLSTVDTPRVSTGALMSNSTLKSTVPLSTISPNQLLCGQTMITHSIEHPSGTTKKLACSANALLTVNNPTAHSSANSVVVFQRGVRKQSTTTASPTVRIATSRPNVTCSGQQSTLISSVVSTVAHSDLPGNRPIRIVNLSSGAHSNAVPGSMSISLPTNTTPVSVAVSENLVLPEPGSALQCSEDFIPNLLKHATNLRASMDVDLDADEVGMMIPEAVVSSHMSDITLTGAVAIVEADAQSHTPAVSLDEVVIRNRLLVAPNHPLPELDNHQMDPPSEIGVSRKVGQLRAILGLSSHPTSPQQQQEHPQQQSCGPATTSMTSVATVLDEEADLFPSDGPDPKRPRLTQNPSIDQVELSLADQLIMAEELIK